LRYDFNQTSFFPSISQDDIIDLEFSLAYYLHIPDINNRDFYEVLALKERLDDMLEKRNAALGNGNVGLMDFMRGAK